MRHAQFERQQRAAAPVGGGSGILDAGPATADSVVAVTGSAVVEPSAATSVTPRTSHVSTDAPLSVSAS